MVNGKGTGSPLAKSRLRKWDSSAARDFAVSDMSSILAFWAEDVARRYARGWSAASRVFWASGL